MNRFLVTISMMVGSSALAASPALDTTPRIAILSAYGPELDVLRAALGSPSTLSANGVEFTLGNIAGKDVVMFLTGQSMVNAAMNTQLVLDRFNISQILFSGVAGGVNPNLNIGDVTVAGRWAQYQEVTYARETAPGVYAPPDWALKYVPTDGAVPIANFGMAYLQTVETRKAGASATQRKFWFDVDPGLLAVAQGLSSIPLKRCDDKQVCLAHEPKLVVGGNGVSGQTFMDNAAFRTHTYQTLKANVLDMETASAAMVAYSNSVPFIAFRSLSDLAGGGPGANEADTFDKIAADNAANVVLAFLSALK
jgi:adenosylhomocysteine nucleosidase